MFTVWKESQLEWWYESNIHTEMSMVSTFEKILGNGESFSVKYRNFNIGH